MNAFGNVGAVRNDVEAGVMKPEKPVEGGAEEKPVEGKGDEAL